MSEAKRRIPDGLVKVRKPRDFKDLGPVDCAQLVKLVSQLPDEIWELEDSLKENKFDVFHHTQHVVFRFTPGNLDPREHYDRPLWTVWEARLLPLMAGLADQYGYGNVVFSKAMLARLRAGQMIDLHSDGAGSNMVTHKIHVPLITNSKALFHIGEETRHLEVGRAFEVNNIARHGVENKGAEDRVHFIFEFFDGGAEADD